WPTCTEVSPVSSSERLTPRQVAVGVDEVTVSLHVAVLPAHDEHDQVVAAGVREPSRRSRLDVDEAARAELTILTFHLEARRPGMDEVELVLPVVVVEETLVAGRHHDRVHAERGHAEGA